MHAKGKDGGGRDGKRNHGGFADDARNGLHAGFEPPAPLVREEIPDALRNDGTGTGQDERRLSRSPEGEETSDIEDFEAWLVSYSGPLPPPEIFYAYEERERAAIIDGYRAATSDESRRQDTIVKAAIRQARFQLLTTAVVNIVAIGGGIAGMVATGDPALLLALLVPGVTVAANVVVNVKGRDGRAEAEDEGALRP